VTVREPTPYVGRFAPSPTGPLHLGSLLAAVASYLQAKFHQGRWLLRIEDIDPPRQIEDADRLILQGLESYGFEWDGPVIRQSASTEQHEACVQALISAGRAYPCSCSRKDISDAPQGELGSIYPGTCRAGFEGDDYAIRLRTSDDAVEFVDGLQGRVRQRLESESGDFIIKRRDGLIAYNLAVVVDDHLQAITEVVRGTDLLDSTPRHIYLQSLLGFASPDYLHIPIAVDASGQKLSKSTGAAAISLDNPGRQLVLALEMLGQSPPPGLAAESLPTIWGWAIAHWDVAQLRGRQQISTP